MTTGNRNSLCIAALVIFQYCLTAAAQTVPVESDEATAQLSDRLNAIESFQGSFVQITLDEDGEILQRQTGATAMVRPSRFLWHVEEPYSQTMLLRDDVVSIYEPDLEQITHSPLTETVDTSVVALLFDDERIEVSDYVVTELSNGFKLEPRADVEIPLSSIEIYFDDRQLVAIDVVDVQNHRTEFSFTRMTFNQPVPESRFAIDVPENTEVIGTPPATSMEARQYPSEELNSN